MRHNYNKGFTLAEVAVTIFIAALVFLAAWSVYLIGSTWWYEISPRIDAQRSARLALRYIIEGRSDSTAGYDIISSSRYGRHNGISYAVFDPDIPSLDRINFGLYQDRNPLNPLAVNNARSFYLGQDAQTGIKALYYEDNGGSVHVIDSTNGLADLTFSKSTDARGKILVTVTAVSEKEVAAAGQQPYQIRVEYTESVYLKNV